MTRAALFVLSLLFTSLVAAQERREPDMCLVPPGAQPRLPATLLEGQGTTRMPVAAAAAAYIVCVALSPESAPAR